MRVPPHVSALARELVGLRGVVAVVLGGSRATNTHRPDSDWDLGAAYGRMAAQREWVLNEKRLAERAGLAEAGPPIAAGDVAAVAALLGFEPLRPR